MPRTSKLDELSKDERDELIRRLAASQDQLCYVCRQVINSQVHEVDVDHIIALAREGADDESNWGLTHKSCNRSKGARDLQLQRILTAFKSHVDKYTVNKGGNFTLHEALEELNADREEVGAQVQDGQVTLSWNEEGKPVSERFFLLDEPGRPPVRSFVARLPYICLHHDHETNPRSIVDLEPMIEEFYLGYPQLQPSLATLTLNGAGGKAKILVFDGQHKAAAQLYAGRDRLMVRVFVDYDKKRLKETNYRAHTKLAQVHFPQLINDRVGTDLFREEFDRFLKDADIEKVSERTFIQKHIAKPQRSEFKQYFQNFLRYEVLTGKAGNQDCHILDFTETITARSKRHPLSYDAVQKTFLQQLLHLKPTTEPVSQTETYRRLERENLVRLMNLFVEEVLANGRWDFQLGTYRMEERLANNPETVPDTHLRAYRMCRRSAMIIWTKELTQAIALLLSTKTRYSNSHWSKDRPLWAEMLQDDWDHIRKMIKAIRDHKVWAERTNSEVVSAVASTRQKDWEQILLNGKLPGRQDQLLPPLDANFIFKASQGMA